MRKKYKFSSDGGESGSKKYKIGYGGVWQSQLFSGVWSQTVGFVLVRLVGICFTYHEDIFAFNLL
jgi:hypothetical protein